MAFNSRSRAFFLAKASPSNFDKLRTFATSIGSLVALNVIISPSLHYLSVASMTIFKFLTRTTWTQVIALHFCQINIAR